MSAPPDEMSCKELIAVVTDYIEGTMAADDRVLFESHLEECPYCVNYLDQMRATIEALGQLSEESIAPGARAGLLEAFRGWRDG